MIVGAMFGASTALQTVILGHMNDSAIAANSVATALFQILKVASVGAASAASVMIGKAIGNGDRKLIKQYTKTLQVIFLMIGLATSLLLFVLRAPILSLYDLSEQTKQMANEFLLILCITCIGTAYEMPVLTGIVRGGGDSKFVFWNDLISIWGNRTSYIIFSSLCFSLAAGCRFILFKFRPNFQVRCSGNQSQSLSLDQKIDSIKNNIKKHK